MNKKNWDLFISEATEIFIAKNTDYDSRFMRALIEYRKRSYDAARTIWAWEVEKKLDRCRSWIKRGELLVKDEGVRNSVIDAFNYTVQWVIFLDANTGLRRLDPLEELTEANFYKTAANYQPKEWIDLWATEGLLDFRREIDAKVADLLLAEMTGEDG